MRYHPAVVAQKAATLGVLNDGRFTLGVGAGVRLNEHVVGDTWPPVDVRHEMLEEAVEILRLLWQGGYQSYRGQYYNVDDARIFDLPERPIPKAIAASGQRSAGLAGRMGDGLIAVGPQPELVEGFQRAGGDGKPTWCQIPICWHPDKSAALKLVHDRFRWATLRWKVMSELPNPVNFDAATRLMTPDRLAGTIPHGPDPEDHLRAIRQYTDAGFDRVALYQIGDDQQGFFRFWKMDLQPRLEEVAPVHASV